MTGAAKGVATDVLYRDMHRLPVLFHWVVLAVRWWTKLSDMREEVPASLASCVWREDVQLALSLLVVWCAAGPVHVVDILHVFPPRTSTNKD
jgi:hypothetical protein